MTSGHGSSAAAPSGEVIHDSDRTRVSRAPAAAGTGTVIRKEFRGPVAGARMRNEVAMLRRLAGLPGIPRLVQAVRNTLMVAGVEVRRRPCSA